MAFEIPIIFLYLAVPSLLLSAISQILTWRRKGSSEAKFPGPQQWPIVGRIHDLNRFGLWLNFKEWADIHGPIYQTSMAGQHFIVVSDEQIAEELLIKRGHIYSGRPQIRALFDHKQSISYLALMDRNGKLHIHLDHERQPKTLTGFQITGQGNASGFTQLWPTPTSTTSTDTLRPRRSDT